LGPTGTAEHAAVGRRREAPTRQAAHQEVGEWRTPNLPRPPRSDIEEPRHTQPPARRTAEDHRSQRRREGDNAYWGRPPAAGKLIVDLQPEEFSKDPLGRPSGATPKHRWVRAQQQGARGRRSSPLPSPPRLAGEESRTILIWRRGARGHRHRNDDGEAQHLPAEQIWMLRQPTCGTWPKSGRTPATILDLNYWRHTLDSAGFL
jgi:hypothetical protein